MRIIKLYALMGFILFVPAYLFAGWEVASSGPGAPVTPREPFFQSKVEHQTVMQSHYVRVPPRHVAAPPHRVAPYRTLPYRTIPYHPPVSSTMAAPLPISHVALSPRKKMPAAHIAVRRGGQGRGLYAVSISGSLKENLERIMSRYHWRVIWKAPYDYNFDGRIIGSSLPNVIEKLLQPFPLQAEMYMSNRTLAISSRPRYKV